MTKRASWVRSDWRVRRLASLEVSTASPETNRPSGYTAAIVSREYGIPGVVGTRDATRTIPDGARVRVDGSKGTVEVIR